MRDYLVPVAGGPQGRYSRFAVVGPFDIVTADRLGGATSYMIPRSR